MELYKKVVSCLDGTEELLNNDYCSKISMSNGEIAEDIYILILNHYIENNSDSVEAIKNGKEFPYLSKTVTKEGKGLNFKVAQIPENLQKIIVRYLILISR
jgi:hypothetical protein